MYTETRPLSGMAIMWVKMYSIANQFVAILDNQQYSRGYLTESY